MMSERFPVRMVPVSFLVLFVTLATGPALGFDARTGATVTIGREEVVEGDLYVAASTVTVNGTVEGDLWAIGRIVTINGVVKGSVMGLGETLNITGDVGHAVRVGGKTVDVSGNVQGDVLAGCGQVNLADQGRVLGDLLLGARTASVAALVRGDVKGGGGDMTISGPVSGDVDLKVEGLTVAPSAAIQGNLTYTSAQEANIQAGAQILGTITHNLPEVKGERGKPFPLALFSRRAARVIGFLMALVAGLVIVLSAPTHLSALAETIRSRPGPTVGWGAVLLFVTPIAATIVCMTLVGIPVGVIALLLYGVAIYLSQVPVALFVGKLIIRRRRSTEGRTVIFGAFALGLVVLRLLRLIPIVGWLIGVAVLLFGLGAVAVALRKPRETGKLGGA